MVQWRVYIKQSEKDQDNIGNELGTMRSRRNIYRGHTSAADLKDTKVVGEYVKAMSTRGQNSCLCGDLSRFDKHLKYVKTSLKHPKACQVCGGDAYFTCDIIYGVPVYFIPSREKHANTNMFL